MGAFLARASVLLTLGALAAFLRKQKISRQLNNEDWPGDPSFRVLGEVLRGDGSPVGAAIRLERQASAKRCRCSNDTVDEQPGASSLKLQAARPALICNALLAGITEIPNQRGNAVNSRLCRSTTGQLRGRSSFSSSILPRWPAALADR
jgi:hypothetical protein